MKVRVRVGERVLEVEVGDLQARPIVATVDGQRFEVWPEGAAVAAAQIAPSPTGENGDRIVRAPIPGVIVSIAVQPGEAVIPGQELCVLEAMKMKNVIRAGRSGQIAAVHAASGQHVAHHEPLLEYAD